MTSSRTSWQANRMPVTSRSCDLTIRMWLVGEINSREIRRHTRNVLAAPVDGAVGELEVHELLRESTTVASNGCHFRVSFSRVKYFSY